MIYVNPTVWVESRKDWTCYDNLPVGVGAAKSNNVLRSEVRLAIFQAHEVGGKVVFDRYIGMTRHSFNPSMAVRSVKTMVQDLTRRTIKNN